MWKAPSRSNRWSAVCCVQRDAKHACRRTQLAQRRLQQLQQMRRFAVCLRHTLLTLPPRQEAPPSTLGQPEGPLGCCRMSPCFTNARRNAGATRRDAWPRPRITARNRRHHCRLRSCDSGYGCLPPVGPARRRRCRCTLRSPRGNRRQCTRRICRWRSAARRRLRSRNVCSRHTQGRQALQQMPGCLLRKLLYPPLDRLPWNPTVFPLLPRRRLPLRQDRIHTLADDDRGVMLPGNHERTAATPPSSCSSCTLSAAPKCVRQERSAPPESHPAPRPNAGTMHANPRPPPAHTRDTASAMAATSFLHRPAGHTLEHRR